MTVGVQQTASSEDSARERVELILGQLDQFPLLPIAVARLFAVAGIDDSFARDLVRIIEPDPSLTACILRMVRHGDLGVRGNRITIDKAVSLLGSRTARNAALSTQVFETLSVRGKHDASIARRRGLWVHSLAVGCAAEMIAERSGGIAGGGEAFACGLLHDIGKIALDNCLPKSYGRVLDHCVHQPVCVCDVEREILGLDHTFAGKRLVTRWRLGRAIVETVWLHHQDPDALPSTMAFVGQVRIVHLADALVRQAGIGVSGSRHATDIESAACPLGLDRAALDKIIECLPKRLKPLQVALGLDDTDDQASYLGSLSEANRRLGQWNMQLTESNRILALRSDCYESLAAFRTQLTDHDRVADVCAAAANLLCSLLRIDRALAFARSPERRCLHLGASDKTGAASRTAVFAYGATDFMGEGKSPGITLAPEGCHALWQQTFGLAPDSPLWCLPFDASAMAGGAVFAADADAIGPLCLAQKECASLSTGIGQAVSSAAFRVVAEKTTEELLEVNRRLHTAQKQLVRMHSISMIAQMAAGAAHELNNPLAVISGRAQMELTKCEVPDKRRELEIIVEQARRASEIVSELMSFAKPDEPKPAIQPLAEALETACQHWRSVSGLGPDQLVVTQRDAGSLVYCDGNQLGEILQAVFANALEATDPAARRIKINSPSSASDETVRIVVEDNGVGMTPEILEHALDPFFSSRPAGRGRGLGLSRAHRLAEINGGSLWLESRPHLGTTVTIELPARAPVS